MRQFFMLSTYIFEDSNKSIEITAEIVQVKQDQNNYNWAIANDYCDKTNPGTPLFIF